MEKYDAMYNYIDHKIEMAKGHLKGLKILITNPKRYSYLQSLRGNKKELKKVKNEVVTIIRKLLKDKQLKFKIQSRIKTIGSIDRKEKYYTIMKRELIFNDSIGLKIIFEKKNDCYKALNLITPKFGFQNIKNRENIEDFFKNPCQMRATNSIARNHIFIKILYKKVPIHIILITKNDIDYVREQRKIYVKFIKNIIRGNK